MNKILVLLSVVLLSGASWAEPINEFSCKEVSCLMDKLSEKKWKDTTYTNEERNKSIPELREDSKWRFMNTLIDLGYSEAYPEANYLPKPTQNQITVIEALIEYESNNNRIIEFLTLETVVWLTNMDEEVRDQAIETFKKAFEGTASAVEIERLNMRLSDLYMQLYAI